MTASTVRREIDAIEPSAGSRLRSAICNWIGGIAIALASFSLQAQVICPFPAFSGNSQTTLAGTRFSLPLVAGQTGATAAIPTTIPVSWRIDPVSPPLGSIYFVANGQTTFNEIANWSVSPPFSFSSSVEVAAPADANGVYTVRAETSACPPMSDRTFNINVVPAAFPNLNPFQGSTQTAITGTPFATQLGALVEQGMPLTPLANAKTTFTILSGPASFSNGTNTISVFSASDGHALTTLIANAGVLSATSVSVQVEALGLVRTYTGLTVAPAGGTPTLTPSPAVGTTYSAETGQLFTNTFSVLLQDSMGLGIAGTPATFVLGGSSTAQLIVGGSPVGTSTSVSTGSTGTAAIQVRAGAAPESFSLSVSVAGFPTTTWNLTSVAAGSQLISIVSGDGQSARPNTQFGQPLTVAALLGGAAQTSIPVQFSIVSGSAFFQGANGPSTVIAITNGSPTPTASVTLIAGASTGDVVVRAAAPGYQPANFNLRVAIPELETVFKISGDTQQAPVGTVLPRPLVAGVSPSAFVSAPGAQLTFDIISGGATFVESGNTRFTATPTGGLLSADANLRLGAQPSDVQVRVSFPGMLPALFTAKGVPTGTASSLLKISGDAQIATTGLTSDPLRVRLSDGGAAVADASISWTLIGGDASLSQSQTRTNAQGESEITLAVGANAGEIRVRASAALADGTNPSVEFMLSAANATLTAVSGSGQSGSIGSDADQVFVFELRRANGSPLSGQTVQFATTSGTLTQTSAVSREDGRVSVGLRYGANAGDVRVTASAFGSRVSSNITATTFVPVLSIFSGNNQSAAAGSSLADPLVVAISRPPAALRAKGLQGLTVNWTVVSGGGALTTATSVTDGNGRASNTLRLGSVIGAHQVRAAIAGVGEVLFTASSGVPANTVLEIVSGNNQRLIPRRASAPLVVRLRTSNGTGLSGFAVRFVASDGVTLNPTDVNTNNDGRAATVANVTLPGDYTVTASLPGLSEIAPVVFNFGNGIANLPGLGTRGTRVARAIDRACPQLARTSNLSAAQQDLLQRCSELVVGARDDSGSIGNVLDRMLADESNAQNNAALASASAQFENLKARFAALRSGDRGVNVGGLALITPTGYLPLSFLPSSLLLGAAEDEQQSVSESFARWGFFATGTIGRGSRDPSDTDPGGDFDNYGLTAGVDYRVTDSFILGGALGFNSNDSSLNQNLGDLDSKGYSLSAYGTWFKGDSYYADGVLTLGRNRTDITRRIDYTITSLSGGTTNINQIASGSPDSDQQSFALSFGRDFNRGAWSFGPYLRGTYTRLDFDGYVERMSDPTGPGAGLALAVDGRELTSLQGVLGGKMSYAVSTSWGILMPSLQVEYVKEFKDDSDGLVTRFAFDPTNTSIVIDGDEIDTDYLNIGLGLSGVFANGRSGYVYYEHVAGKDRTTQNSIAVGIRIEF